MPMQPAQLEVLRALLTERRVLSLSVVVEGAPVIGLLPFAVTADWHGLVVHASRLARHTKGLHEGAPFDVLVHEPDSADVDPMQVKRVTLRGVVREPADEGPARDAYLARFPEAAPITQLGDFSFYVLEINGGRLVTGFAGAVNVTMDTLAALNS